MLDASPVPPLTLAEKTRLHQLERQISTGIESFISVGKNLIEIRDSGLWREDYSSFEQYLTRRWGISMSRGKDLMRSTQVAENLLAGPAGPNGDAPLPQDLSEQTMRPLSKLSAELQCATWSLATRITQKPTHAVVSGIVRAIQQAINAGYGESTPKPKRAEPANTIFLRVVYKLGAMESVAPQLLVSAIAQEAQARRCISACREVARRCNVIAEELIEKFPKAGY